MQIIWIPTGTVVTTFIGIAGYLGKRYLERRRETEALALLIQAADLRMKLRQSGATLQDLLALQREALSPHQPQETSAADLGRHGRLIKSKQVRQPILSPSDKSIS